jgi:hypothetical protein
VGRDQAGQAVAHDYTVHSRSGIHALVCIT